VNCSLITCTLLQVIWRVLSDCLPKRTPFGHPNVASRVARRRILFASRRFAGLVRVEFCVLSTFSIFLEFLHWHGNCAVGRNIRLSVRMTIHEFSQYKGEIISQIWCRSLVFLTACPRSAAYRNRSNENVCHKVVCFQLSCFDFGIVINARPLSEIDRRRGRSVHVTEINRCRQQLEPRRVHDRTLSDGALHALPRCLQSRKKVAFWETQFDCEKNNFFGTMSRIAVQTIFSSLESFLFVSQNREFFFLFSAVSQIHFLLFFIIFLCIILSEYYRKKWSKEMENFCFLKFLWKYKRSICSQSIWSTPISKLCEIATWTAKYFSPATFPSKSIFYSPVRNTQTFKYAHVLVRHAIKLPHPWENWKVFPIDGANWQLNYFWKTNMFVKKCRATHKLPFSRPFSVLW